jgi:hypothetical protein
MYCNSWCDDDDDMLQHKMDAIKVEPASDDETDTVSSVHDFLQINIKSEYSLAVEAEASEVKVCSVLNGFLSYSQF